MPRPNTIGLLTLALAICLLLPTVAMGHAHYESSVPAREATVTTAPREVRLQFSEPVHVNTSMFKVYPLEPQDDPLLLRAAASELMSRALVGIDRRQDEAERADASILTTRTPSAEIVLRMKENLAPGPYVVMWRILSVDTHTTQGSFIFYYEPEA